MPETMNLAGMTSEDRATIQALANSMNAIAVQQQAALRGKEKGWFSKVADAIEEHPICTLSVVLIAGIAVESYIMYKSKQS